MEGALVLSRAELQRLANRRRVALGVLEKDYVLTEMLTALSQVPVLNEDFVFKGGTALRHPHSRRVAALQAAGLLCSGSYQIERAPAGEGIALLTVSLIRPRGSLMSRRTTYVQAAVMTTPI